MKKNMEDVKGLRIGLLSILFCGYFIFFTGCNSNDDQTFDSRVVIQEGFSVSFLKSLNSSIKKDIYVDFSNDSVINLFVPKLRTDSLVVSYDEKRFCVEVGGAHLYSGKTVCNFNGPVNFEITKVNNKNTSETKKIYTLNLKGGNGIPIVDITVENMQEVYSKEEYLNARIWVYNAPEYGLIDSICKIKGRGHGTWRANRDNGKKPYKIKFNNRTSLFSFPACKKWVLLSVPVDKSFLRNPIMFETGKALNMDYIPNYQYVDLYVNHTYRGLYLLADQIEIDKNRINDIEEEGFFIEKDNSWNEESLYFYTPKYYNYFTFKYPDPDAGQIKEDDERFCYIKNFVIDFENSILAIIDGNRQKYKNFMDVESFAKWYVASQLIANYDPNFYYVLKNKGAKLKMITLWDADWCLGNGGHRNWKWISPPEKIDADTLLYWHYYSFLVKDSYFNNKVLDEWKKLKVLLPQIKEKILSMSESLSYAQKDNFTIWPILGSYQSPGLTNFSTWKEEVDYVLEYLDKRIDFLDKHFEEVAN